MLKRTLLFVSLGSGLLIDAQAINEANAATKTSGKIGINTDIPTRTLTIKNTAANNGKPVLRLAGTPKHSANVNSVMDADLGGNTTSTVSYDDYRPLIIDKVGDVYQGVPFTNNTSILTITINDVKGDWIANFDTGINYNKYAVAIMSASFKLPTSAGNLVMLVGSTGVPAVRNSAVSYSSRIAPPTVILKQSGANWAIQADYANMDLVAAPQYSNTRGTEVNGSWVITLLVGRRDGVNFSELDFSQGGNHSGTGITDTTYRNKLEAFLERMD